MSDLCGKRKKRTKRIGDVKVIFVEPVWPEEFLKKWDPKVLAEEHDDAPDQPAQPMAVVEAPAPKPVPTDIWAAVRGKPMSEVSGDAVPVDRTKLKRAIRAKGSTKR